MAEENNYINRVDDHSRLMLIVERQREMLKRLEAVEKKQKDAETLINRYMGGIALLIGVGVLAGWWITIKGGLPLWH
jgi:hypothetical protein